MWFKRHHSRIALDIGPASVAACQIRRTRRDRPTLHRWGRIEDPLRQRPTWTRADPAGAIPSDRVGRLVAQLGFRGRGVVLALKPPDVHFLPVALPAPMLAAPTDQLRTAMSFEAARELQVDPKSVVVDGWSLPPGNRSGHNLMICAASRTLVDNWSAAAEALGLWVERVETAPSALLRVAWRSQAPRLTTERVWGVLDLGFAASVLALARGPECIFVRNLSIAGDALTLAILDALGVDYATAEMLKREYSVLPTGGDAGPGTGAATVEVPQALHSVIRQRVKALASDVERAFSYALESYPDLAAGPLFLAGGGCRLKGLPEALGEHLGIDVALLDPRPALELNPAGPPLPPDEQPGAGPSIGAALGDFE